MTKTASWACALAALLAVLPGAARAFQPRPSALGPFSDWGVSRRRPSSSPTTTAAAAAARPWLQVRDEGAMRDTTTTTPP